MKFQTYRMVQFFRFAGRIGDEQRLHNIIYLLQQKKHSYDFYFTAGNAGVYSNELRNEIEFLLNTGFLKESGTPAEKVYETNYGAAFEATTGLSRPEQEVINLLQMHTSTVLADTAALCFYNANQRLQGNIISNKIKDLAPDLFNNTLEGHRLYRALTEVQ